ncbi:MAG: NPCBM/NEW2 domain-containing protein [Pirellulales bacterium]
MPDAPRYRSIPSLSTPVTSTGTKLVSALFSATLALTLITGLACPATGQTPGWLWSASTEPRRAILTGAAPHGWSFLINSSVSPNLESPPEPFVPSDADFRGWYRPPVPPAAPSLWLTDGSHLTGQIQEIDDQTVAVQTPLLGRVTFARAELHAVELQGPLGAAADRAVRSAELSRLPLNASPATLWLANGDQLPADLVRMTADHLECTHRGETFQLERTAVAAWRRSRPTEVQENGPGNLRVTLADGSQLTVRQITSQDDYRLVLQRPDGSDWPATSFSNPWWDDLVTGIEPIARVLRLSDRPELNYRQQSLLGPSIPLQRNLSAARTPLSVAGAYFADGLGARSLSRLTLAVEPSWQAFQALVGVDDSGGESGSVVFRVLTYSDRDGWRERATTETVRHGDAPVPIHVSLLGAQRLALVVDPADDGDSGDLANWLMARIVLPN